MKEQVVQGMGVSQTINTNPNCASSRQSLFGSAPSHSGCNHTYTPSLTQAALTTAGKEARVMTFICVLSQGWQTAGMNTDASPMTPLPNADITHGPEVPSFSGNPNRTSVSP